MFKDRILVLNNLNSVRTTMIWEWVYLSRVYKKKSNELVVAPNTVADEMKFSCGFCQPF
jgi:hypothetical protein